MPSQNEIYSKVEIRKVPAFKMAGYVMISSNPESDMQNYMKNQGRVSGLTATNSNAKLIGSSLTVTEPFASPFERIPRGYKCIIEFLQANDLKDKLCADIICCFE